MDYIVKLLGGDAEGAGKHHIIKGRPVLSSVQFLRERVEQNLHLQYLLIDFWEWIGRDKSVEDLMVEFMTNASTFLSQSSDPLAAQIELYRGELVGPVNGRQPGIFEAAGLLDRPFIHLTFGAGDAWYAILTSTDFRWPTAVSLVDGGCLFEDADATLVGDDGQAWVWDKDGWIGSGIPPVNGLVLSHA